MLSAILAWLGSEGLKILLGTVVAAFMDWWKSVQAAQAQRDAGRAEAKSATLQQNADRVQAAKAVEIEAARSHAANPTTDDGFDRAFERKD